MASLWIDTKLRYFPHSPKEISIIRLDKVVVYFQHRYSLKLKSIK